VRLFRNNTGVLRDANGRPVSFGLCKGSADLIGWTTRTITADMVGQQVAVFTSIEVKALTGRLRPEQKLWLEVSKPQAASLVWRGLWPMPRHCYEMQLAPLDTGSSACRIWGQEARASTPHLEQ
jgi:hypothetical protein